jgi:hypothetical protein
MIFPAYEKDVVKMGHKIRESIPEGEKKGKPFVFILTFGT